MPKESLVKDLIVYIFENPYETLGEDGANGFTIMNRCKIIGSDISLDDQLMNLVENDSITLHVVLFRRQRSLYIDVLAGLIRFGLGPEKMKEPIEIDALATGINNLAFVNEIDDVAVDIDNLAISAALSP